MQFKIILSVQIKDDCETLLYVLFRTTIIHVKKSLEGFEASECNCHHFLLHGHISARVLTRTWAEREASYVQAPFAGISYVVFGSWDLGKPFSSPT